VDGPRVGAVGQQLLLVPTLSAQPVVDRVGRDRCGQRSEVLRRRGGNAGELLEAPVRESGLARRALRVHAIALPSCC
jgi:hypothetical protein